MRRWVFWTVLVATGCAGRGGSSTRFPAPGKVDRIALDPLPPGDPPEVADVAEWTATGPFPSKHGSEPRRELDAWDALLGERPKSEAARCVARELARFRVKHRASPSEDLERWLA